MAWLSRLIDSFRGYLPPDPLRAVHPPVTPDPQSVADLERKRSELTFQPSGGFHRDNVTYLHERESAGRSGFDRYKRR